MKKTIKLSDIVSEKTLPSVRLVYSIRKHGILNDPVVRPIGKKYEVVFGNKRINACRLLGYEQVCCDVQELNDKQVIEVVKNACKLEKIAETN